MAGRLQNLSNLFSDMKSRTIILATAGVLVTAFIVGLIGFNRQGEQAQTQTKLQTAPQGIQSIPGISPTSPEYKKLQVQLNESRRQQAVQQSKSFVPTVISQTDTNTKNISDSVASLLNGGVTSDKSDGTNGDGNGSGDGTGTDGSTLPGAGGNNGAGKANNAANAQDTAELKSQLAALQSQMSDQQQKLEQMNQQQVQQATQQVQQNMTTEAQSLMTAWSGGGVPTQSYVQGSAADDLAQQRQTQQANAAAIAAQPGPPIIKAGTILFASLNTSVDSDEPGPVLATVVTGDFQNARLVGSVQQTQDQSGLNRPEKVQLTFSTMNIPSKATTISINAVAIDPDTARTALASNVDHHYLLRYGSLFASSFMEGYGNAVTQSGQTVTNFVSGGQTQQFQKLNPAQEIAAGFGQVGQQWGQQMGQLFNRPNTITVNAGSSVGILFLADVTLNAAPLTTQAPMQMTSNSTYNTSTQSFPSNGGSQ